MLQNSLFDLKILKLFLLNNMENKESRKIGLAFLPFSVIFYIFVKLDRKRKRKNFNSTRPILAEVAQACAEMRTRPCPRWRLYRKALGVLNN
jgi:hypothetical protein